MQLSMYYNYMYCNKLYIILKLLLVYKNIRNLPFNLHYLFKRITETAQRRMQYRTNSLMLNIK